MKLAAMEKTQVVIKASICTRERITNGTNAAKTTALKATSHLVQALGTSAQSRVVVIQMASMTCNTDNSVSGGGERRSSRK